MKLSTCAKINIGLNVVSRRDDGYHNLETVFFPVPLYDTLELHVEEGKSGGRCELTMSGITISGDIRDNLVVRAYHYLNERYSLPSVRVHLNKEIPSQAGLGGGSSDAAAMLKLLNEEFCLNISEEELCLLARELGADCPFFVYNRPCYAEGIGDQLTPIDLDLKGTRIVMIKPEEGVSTKEAYSGIMISGEGLVVSELKSLGSLGAVGSLRSFRNDFEASVFPKHPIIAEIKKRLLDAGAYYASMTGSGSTVFGLFKQDTEGRTDAHLALLKQEFASMILLDDSFGEWKS